MTYTKTLVCLANSRKTAGRCIAGKEMTNGNPGQWFRPISSRATHEISEEERRFQDGQDPKLLDIISIPCSQPQPSPYQGENHLIAPGYYWERSGRLAWADLAQLLDHPASLWSNGESSYAFLNNRVQDSYAGGRSLHLVAVESLEVLVGSKSDQYPKRIVRGEFTYQGVPYRMSVTDPAIERHFLERGDGSYTIQRPYLCISLGDPFQGYLYKLIASVLFEDRFR